MIMCVLKFLFRRTCVADMIQVDVCINLMVLLRWEVARQVSDSIEVYNCTSSAHNPITWGEFESFGHRIIDKYRYESVLWYPGGSYKENWYYNRFCEVKKIQKRIANKNLSKACLPLWSCSSSGSRLLAYRTQTFPCKNQ